MQLLCNCGQGGCRTDAADERRNCITAADGGAVALQLLMPTKITGAGSQPNYMRASRSATSTAEPAEAAAPATIAGTNIQGPLRRVTVLSRMHRPCRRLRGNEMQSARFQMQSNSSDAGGQPGPRLGQLASLKH